MQRTRWPPAGVFDDRCRRRTEPIPKPADELTDHGHLALLEQLREVPKPVAITVSSWSDQVLVWSCAAPRVPWRGQPSG